MTLPENLIRDFASLLNDKRDKKERKESTGYGTAHKSGTSITVTIDGSEIATPAASLVDVADGDRVMVSIKNHSVIIIGNVTSPSLTRLGDTYIVMTEDGLKVGKIGKNDQPVGAYLLISPTGTALYNSSGTLLASFGERARLGRVGKSYTVIDEDSLIFYDKNDEAIAAFNSLVPSRLASSIYIDRSYTVGATNGIVKVIPGIGDREPGNAVALYAHSNGSRGIVYYTVEEDNNEGGHWLIYRTADGQTLVPDLCKRTVHTNTTDSYIATQQYSDGRLVTDMRVRYTPNFSNAWGSSGLYYVSQTMPNFPIAYIAAPIVVTTVRHISGTSISMLICQNTASATNPGTVYLGRPATGSNQVEITIHAEGMWK